MLKQPKVISTFKPLLIEMLHRETGLEQINAAQMTEAINRFAHIFYEQSLLGEEFKNFILKHGELKEAERIVKMRALEDLAQEEEVLP